MGSVRACDIGMRTRGTRTRVVMLPPWYAVIAAGRWYTRRGKHQAAFDAFLIGDAFFLAGGRATVNSTFFEAGLAILRGGLADASAFPFGAAFAVFFFAGVAAVFAAALGFRAGLSTPFPRLALKAATLASRSLANALLILLSVSAKENGFLLRGTCHSASIVSPVFLYTNATAGSAPSGSPPHRKAHARIASRTPSSSLPFWVA